MNYKIVLFIILFPVVVGAQSVGRQDSLMINKVISDLKDSWTLGIDNNSKSVDLKVYNKFKALFDSNATIDDDFNYQFIPEKKTGKYVISIKPKPFDLYAHDVALEVSKMIIEYPSPNDSVGQWQGNTISVRVERKVWAEKPRKYVLKDVDSLAKTIVSYHPEIEFEKKTEISDRQMMLVNLRKSIQQNPDSVYQFYSTSALQIVLIKINDTIKIKSINNPGKTLAVKCRNDNDMDAVLNGEEADSIAANEYGDFTANGRPDDDFDGVPNAIDKCRYTYSSTKSNQGCPDSYFITNSQHEVFLGLQQNSADINLPELNQLGYRDESGNDAMDVLQSDKGILKDPGKIPGIYAGYNFSYYFGEKRRNTGISIGFTYTSFKADYQLMQPIVYTYKSSDGTNQYRRQVKIKSLKEVIAYNIINLPVMFNFRFKPFDSQKFVVNMKAGPSFMIFNNTSDYNASVNFGGLYQVDTVSKDAITYYDRFDPGSKWNVILTPESINAQNPNPGAGTVFSQLFALSNNYDFASNKNYRENIKLTRITVAFNVACDFQYNITKGSYNEKGMALKLGVHFVYAPLPERKDKYIPLDKTTDEFNSIYNSSAKSSYSAVGGNLGFVYRF